METLSVIWAIGARGRRLSLALSHAATLARAAGAPTIVVLLRSRGVPPRRPAAGVTVVRSEAATAGAALLTGARQAPGTHCLLVDDGVRLTPAAVTAHRRMSAAHGTLSIGPLLGAPPRWTVDGDPDPAVAFGISLGRNACIPRERLVEAPDDALEDSARAYAFAGELLRLGLSLRMADEAGAAWAGGGTAARDRGASAVDLYRRFPGTLPHSGLGGFRRAPFPLSVARRALVAIPRSAEALEMAGRIIMSRRSLRGVGEDALYWKGVRSALDRREWRRLAGGTAILMFHGFGDGEPASRFVVPAGRFRRQLLLLWLMRRQVISLESYVDARRDHALPHARSTVVTIDDGYEDAYTVAAPLLRRRRFPATVFLVSGHVGGCNDWDAKDGSLRGRRLAGFELIRDGLGFGIDAGAHGRSHRLLPGLDDEQLASEVAGSRRDLAEALNRPVTTFAYPHGYKDDRTQTAVIRAGYSAACSCRDGKNDVAQPLDCLRRVEVKGYDSLLHFVLIVASGRRWR
jgi:peptidoglycan/xylan/chitin deacetylase (PgdA/CDA1 family)